MKRKTLKTAQVVGSADGSVRERGIALLVSVFVLMLVGLVAVSAMQNSEDESTAGSRTRSAVSALYLADAGIEVALLHIQELPPDSSPITVDLGDGLTVQSRGRDDDTAQELAWAGTGVAPDGYAVGEYYSNLFQVNMTALQGTRAVAEVEAKLGSFAVGGSGH